MAAWAEDAYLTAESDQELLSAVFTPDPGKAVFKDAAVEELVDGTLEREAKGAVFPFESFFVECEEALEVLFQKTVER
jgi:hypothetical protein